MDFEEACDRAEEIEFSMTGDRRLAALRREIDALDVGETGRAMFLCSLAEFLGFQGRWDEAREAYRNALSDGGRTI
ncbi:MAG TPA: hypothetical protein VNZ66_08005, partial [Aeromicrobium sp.]|nr:hypothetical protein [Aeromicrobium sp.]